MQININEHFNWNNDRKEQQKQFFENKYLSLWKSLNVFETLEPGDD